MIHCLQKACGFQADALACRPFLVGTGVVEQIVDYDHSAEMEMRGHGADDQLKDDVSRLLGCRPSLSTGLPPT